MAGIGAVLAFVGWLWRRSDAAKPAEEGKKKKRLRAKLGTGYDIVLANIVADVIIPLAPYARECMAPGGAFITSGIIDGRQDEVAAAITGAGFTIEQHLSEDGWHAFLCR